MGLDNGLVIKGKSIRAKKFLDKKFSHLEEKYSPGEYEFAYFRKCWNIRQRFLDTFDYNGENYKIKLCLADAYTIVEKIFKYFLNEDNWEYNGHTSQVFEWYEILPTIARGIGNLRFFIEELETASNEGNPYTEEDFDFYFYDSY